VDDRQAPKKQRHTAQRIFERLRDEHGYQGGRTVVKDAVRAWRQSHQEVFLPLWHPPGEAQVDFGEATVRLAGEGTKMALFVITLPYSGAIFIQAFPRECTETFLEGHRRAFESLGGVPNGISYDNSAIVDWQFKRAERLTRSPAIAPQAFCYPPWPLRTTWERRCSRGVPAAPETAAKPGARLAWLLRPRPSYDLPSISNVGELVAGSLGYRRGGAGGDLIASNAKLAIKVK
jgi:hypothetical protein